MLLGYIAQRANLTPPLGGDVLPTAGQVVEGDIQSSAVFSKILPFLINWGIRLAIVLSVLALIYGGYQMMASLGNAETKDAAKKTITWALIGLIISLTAFGIVSILTRVTAFSS